MKRIDEASFVTIGYDGWTVDATKIRNVGFLIRVATSVNSKVEEYLVDLMPIEGREKAPAVAAMFRRFALWLGLATMEKPPHWTKTINPHLQREVLVPTAEWAPTIDEENLDDAFPNFKFDPKVVGVISDNAEVIRKANSLLGVISQPCNQHALNNVTKKSLTKDKGSTLQFADDWDRIQDFLYRIHRFPLLFDMCSDLATIFGLAFGAVEKMAAHRWMFFELNGRKVLKYWPALSRLEDLVLEHATEFEAHAKAIVGNGTRIFTDDKKKALEQALFMVEPLVSLNESYNGSKESLVAPISIFNAVDMNITVFHQLTYRVLDVYIQTSSVNPRIAPAVEVGLRLLDFYASTLLKPMSDYTNDEILANIHPIVVGCLFGSRSPAEVVHRLKTSDPIFRALFRGKIGKLDYFPDVKPPYVDLEAYDFPDEDEFRRALRIVLPNFDINSLHDSDSDSDASSIAAEVARSEQDLQSSSSMDDGYNSDGSEKTSTDEGAVLKRWEAFFPDMKRYLKRPAQLPAALDATIGEKESRTMGHDIGCVNSHKEFLEAFSAICYVGYWYCLAGLSDSNLRQQYVAFAEYFELRGSEPSTSSNEPRKASSGHPTKSGASRSKTFLSQASLRDYWSSYASIASHSSVTFATDMTEDVRRPADSFDRLVCQPPLPDPNAAREALRTTNSIASEVIVRLSTFSPSTKRVEEAFSTAADVANKKRSSLSSKNRAMMTVLADTSRRLPIEFVSKEIMKWGNRPTDDEAICSAIGSASCDLKRAVSLSRPNVMFKSPRVAAKNQQLTAHTSEQRSNPVAAEQRMQWTLKQQRSKKKSHFGPADAAGALLSMVSSEESMVVANARRRRQEAIALEKGKYRTPGGLSEHRSDHWNLLDAFRKELSKKKKVPADFMDRFRQFINNRVDKDARKSTIDLFEESIDRGESSTDSLQRLRSLLTDVLALVARKVPWKDLPHHIRLNMESDSSSEDDEHLQKQSPSRTRRRPSSTTSLEYLQPATKKLSLPRAAIPDSDQLQRMLGNIKSKADLVTLLSTSLASVPSSTDMAKLVSNFAVQGIVAVSKDIANSLDQGSSPEAAVQLSLVHFQHQSHKFQQSATSMDCDQEEGEEHVDIEPDSDEESSWGFSLSNADTGEVDQDLEATPTAEGDNDDDFRQITDDIDERNWPGTCRAVEESKRDIDRDDAAWKEELAMLVAFLDKPTYYLIDVEPNGNCAYSSLLGGMKTIGVKNAPAHVAKLRLNLVNYMKFQPADWFLGLPLRCKKKRLARRNQESEDFEWIDLTPEQARTRYIDDQTKDGNWGDINVIKAAVELYKVNVNVHFIYKEQMLTHCFAPEFESAYDAPIELCLVKYIHYMFLCPQELYPKLKVYGTKV